MDRQEIKQAVLNWIESGCNYEEGVMLYSVHGKNKMLKNLFPSKKHLYQEKLVYELCKSVGVDYPISRETENQPINSEKNDEQKLHIKAEKLDTIETQRNLPINTESAAEKSAEMPEVIEIKNIAEYPPIIRRVISEYAEVFQQRSKIHRIMTEMPQGNSQALKTKRAELFTLVKSLTDRLEQLYEVREKYEADGLVPEEDEIWPKPKEKAKTELPDDHDQLRKMKKNQQSANTKDQSMLDYQSEKQGDIKRPMPQGPKRMKIENRIKARIKMIEEIDYKLLDVTVK